MPSTPSIGIDQNGEKQFIDKYYGRVPMMLHSIPERDIWECNPEFMTLVNDFISGDLNEDNISDELLLNIKDLVNKMGGGIPITEEESHFFECYGFSLNPNPITDFAASDGARGKIVFTWTNDTIAIPAANYDIMQQGTPDVLIKENAQSGYELLGENITGVYYLREYNSGGSIQSNNDVGSSLGNSDAPGPITDLDATDVYSGVVYITWTHTDVGFPASRYSIIEDGVVIEDNVSSPYMRTVGSGTRTYQVRAYNSVGAILSNTDIGISVIPNATPAAPTNFNATDDQVGQVTCTWINESHGVPTSTYNLVEDGIVVATNITSPYIHTVANGTRVYNVVAVNSMGSKSSNTDSGTSDRAPVAPQPITVVATKTLWGRVEISWTPYPDTVAYPEPTYRILKDGVVLADNLTDNSYEDSIGFKSSYIYTIEASNASGTERNSDIGKSGLLTVEYLTLPQFNDTTSLTYWVEQQGVSRFRDLEIDNSLDQPTLLFDGNSPVHGEITFINSGSVKGTRSGDDGLICDYEVRLLNNGDIFGAGGDGGNGATGKPSDNRIIKYGTTLSSGTELTSANGFDISFSQDPNVTANQQINVKEQGKLVTDVFSIPFGGTPELRQLTDGPWVNITPGADSLTPTVGGKVELNESYFVEDPAQPPCTVPGNVGGQGGQGGVAASYINPVTIPPTIPPAVPPANTGCGGETGYQGEMGAVGGYAGDFGVDGLDGTSLSTTLGNSGLGQQHGYAIKGQLSQGSVIGNVLGGVI